MDYTQARVNMVKSQVVPNMIRDPALLAGLMKIPREEFVHTAYRDMAYSDIPVPWNNSSRRSLTPLQTAWLIQAMEVKADQRVLVIGAGSGYECALLREMGATVFALEADAALAERGKTLSGFDRITWRSAPLHEGWQGDGLFDAILVCGAIPRLPANLVKQLNEVGVMVVILGQEGDVVMQAVRVQSTARQEILFDTAASVLPDFESKQGFVL